MFDDDEVSIELKREIESKYERLDYLIHKVFQQDEAGRELLAYWKEALVMNPSALGGMDSISIGIEEGKKQFIRHIILTIKRQEAR